MGGGSQPATTNQVSKVELPAWVNDAAMSNYKMAQQVAGRPLEQFQGQEVADPSAMTTQGYDALKGMIGQNDPAFAEAEDLWRKGAGPLDIQSFLNPYTAEVERNAIGQANTALDKNLRGVSDAATKAGSFGGSRAAVESGVTRAEGIRNIGDLTGQLRARGFDTAVAGAQNQQGAQRASAAGLTGTAAGRQAAGLADVSALLGAGSQETGSRQKVIDAAKNKWTEARNYPVEQLNLLLASLGMSPYGKTETSNKTATAEVPATDWATIGLGAAKALPGLVGMFSDRNAKTDIKKLTDGDIPIYSYRYKDDPKSYPKVVGPMAQDIEKKYPSAVKKVGKHRVVDLNNLMEVLS
jgi:hypothetical protein